MNAIPLDHMELSMASWSTFFHRFLEGGKEKIAVKGTSGLGGVI